MPVTWDRAPESGRLHTGHLGLGGVSDTRQGVVALRGGRRQGAVDGALQRARAMLIWPWAWSMRRVDRLLGATTAALAVAWAKASAPWAWTRPRLGASRAVPAMQKALLALAWARSRALVTSLKTCQELAGGEGEGRRQVGLAGDGAHGGAEDDWASVEAEATWPWRWPRCPAPGPGRCSRCWSAGPSAGRCWRGRSWRRRWWRSRGVDDGGVRSTHAGCGADRLESDGADTGGADRHRCRERGPSGE